MKQVQIRMPREMREAIDTSRASPTFSRTINRWVVEAASTYLGRGHGWELPLAPLPRGVEYARVWVRLPEKFAEKLRDAAAAQPLGHQTHSLAGYLRRIIAWRLAREADDGVILRNHSYGYRHRASRASNYARQ